MDERNETTEQMWKVTFWKQKFLDKRVVFTKQDKLSEVIAKLLVHYDNYQEDEDWIKIEPTEAVYYG